MLPFVRVGLICALWMLSLTMLIVRSVLYDWPQLAVLSAWSLWVGSIALAVTVWHVLVGVLSRERVRVETIAELAADVAVSRAGLDSIGSPDHRA